MTSSRRTRAPNEAELSGLDPATWREDGSTTCMTVLSAAVSSPQAAQESSSFQISTLVFPTQTSTNFSPSSDTSRQQPSTTTGLGDPLAQLMSCMTGGATL